MPYQHDAGEIDLSSLGVVLQWARESCCYCEKCPGSLIHLRWAFCQLISWLNNMLCGGQHGHWVSLALSKTEVTHMLPIIFKLPFSHPITEILLPAGVFLLPRTTRLMALLSLVRFVVTWGYFKPKTHPVYRCSDVKTLSTDGWKYIKCIPVFALNVKHPCIWS